MDIVTLGNINTTPANGLRKTIYTMHAMERVTLSKHPTFKHWVLTQFASDCPACYPGQIWTWVKNNFVFVSDEPFEEIIRAPHVMLVEKAGDCDDYSVFIKTCLDILGGWNTSFCILAKEAGKFSHVCVYAERPGMNDHVFIDGLYPEFNQVNSIYKFMKLV